MIFTHEGRNIGTLKEGVFRKRVKKSKHLMRIFDAWGIQYSAVQALERQCEEIRILEEEENIVYHIPFSKLYEEGRVEDFGDGLQVFLTRSEWGQDKLK